MSSVPKCTSWLGHKFEAALSALSIPKLSMAGHHLPGLLTTTGSKDDNMGRKRKPGVKRTATGRPSRSQDAYQENIDPILTRMRLFGLTEKDARDQKAATFIGRLQLTKVVSQVQYDASQEYLSAREAFQRAIKSPDALRSGSGGGDQGESDTYAEWCQRAIKRFEAAKKAVMDEQCILANRGRNLFAGLDYIVCRDEQQWHLVGDCRLALNALAHHFSGQKGGSVSV